MRKFKKNIIEFLMEPRPFFCLYYLVIIIISFSIGVVTSSGFNTKFITVFIGIIAAGIAFIGVMYNKSEEEKLFNIKKIEEFSENLFEWIQIMDNLFISLFDLKENGDNQHCIIDMLSSDNIEIRRAMTDVLKYKGKHLTYISLYRNFIKNDDLICKFNCEQQKAIKHVGYLLRSTTPEAIEKNKGIINESLVLMKTYAKELVEKVEVKSY